MLGKWQAEVLMLVAAEQGINWGSMAPWVRRVAARLCEKGLLVEGIDATFCTTDDGDAALTALGWEAT